MSLTQKGISIPGIVYKTAYHKDLNNPPKDRDGIAFLAIPTGTNKYSPAA
jgi:hypothetical protein